jgi:hypothetical protein
MNSTSRHEIKKDSRFVNDAHDTTLDTRTQTFLPPLQVVPSDFTLGDHLFGHCAPKLEVAIRRKDGTPDV